MNVQKTNYTKEKVRELQRKLYLSAKANKKRRFHALYDKLYRKDIIEQAWEQVKAKKGASGVDNITIDQIREMGEEEFLNEITEQLRKGEYYPKPVRRVYIPKKNGKKRPLGIPTVKDRIIQMAMKIVVEPIFEADFKYCSYGFRPKRNAHMALKEIYKEMSNGKMWIVDADIKGYFDNINHEKLMILVKERISDKRIIKLIKKWLDAGIIEQDDLLTNTKGAPQGGVISPLLSNIYLNYLDAVWEKKHNELGKLIRYCDDFVIIAPTKRKAEEAYAIVKDILVRLELELQEEKTKIVTLWDNAESFDFLGIRHKRIKLKSKKGVTYYKAIQYPTHQAMKKMRTGIKEILGRRNTTIFSMREIIMIVNKRIRGYRNYYDLKHTKLGRRWLKKIDWYICTLMIRWYNKKRQEKQKKRDSSKIVKLAYQMGLAKMAMYS